MAHDTEDFEALLDHDHINAVDYDEDTDTVLVFADDPGAVNLDDINIDDHDVEVIQSDTFTPDLLDPADPPLTAHSTVTPNARARHRPVKLGTSECLASSTAATGGYFPVMVKDSSVNSAEYDKDADGYLVKLSNSHVYADEGNAEFGAQVVQPSPYDTDERHPSDDVGTLLAHVPIEDGVTVDAAIRTCNPIQESMDGVGLDHTWPTGIYRGDYADLKGETLVKTGRTTGVTEGEVLATSASARVRYSSSGVTLTRDQIATTDMSAGGDSGSPYFTEDGKLVGMGFAGSSRRTLLNKAENIEDELGVKFMHWDENAD